MGPAQDEFSPARVFGRPKPDQLWLGPTQRRALTFLRTPINGTTKLLLGPRGCGKSTLLEAFLEELAGTLFFKASDRWESGAALLQALVESADLTPTDGHDVTRRNLFSSYLTREHSLGQRIIIAVDDTERLDPDVWRELDRLRGIRCDDGYVPELILVGRPDAYAYLQSPSGAGWQSVRLMTHTLKGFDANEIIEYIGHRLSTAGLRSTIFTDPALELIAHLAGGSLISANLLCQMSLVHARKQAARIVTEGIVRSSRMAIGRRRAPAPDTGGAAGVRRNRPGELLVRRGDRLVARYPLTAHMLLGRSEYNDVCLKSHDINRHHAAIVQTPRGHEIVDLDSDKGFSVNGRPSSRHTLSDRDVVTVGPYRLEVVESITDRPRRERRASLQTSPVTRFPQTP